MLDGTFGLLAARESGTEKDYYEYHCHRENPLDHSGLLHSWGVNNSHGCCKRSEHTRTCEDIHAI